MALRSWRFLTFVLLLAAASPPPRVTNALIAATQRQDPSRSKKTFQSRARNRIGPAIQVATCRTIAGLASGPRRASRPSRFLARGPESPAKVPPPSPSPAPRSPLRLRC